jgi:hypothetical protein
LIKQSSRRSKLRKRLKRRRRRLSMHSRMLCYRLLRGRKQLNMPRRRLYKMLLLQKKQLNKKPSKMQLILKLKKCEKLLSLKKSSIVKLQRLLSRPNRLKSLLSKWQLRLPKRPTTNKSANSKKPPSKKQEKTLRTPES